MRQRAFLKRTEAPPLLPDLYEVNDWINNINRAIAKLKASRPMSAKEVDGLDRKITKLELIKSEFERIKHLL